MSENTPIEKTSGGEPPSPKRQRQHDEEMHPSRSQAPGGIKGASPNRPESGSDGVLSSTTRSGPSAPTHPSHLSAPYASQHGHSGYVSHPGAYHGAHPSYHHYGQAPPPPHHHHMSSYGHPSHHPAPHYPPPGHGGRWPQQHSSPPASIPGGNQGGIFRPQDPYYGRQGQSPARGHPPPGYGAHPPPQGHRSGPSVDPRQPVYGGGYGAMPPHAGSAPPHHQSSLGGPSPPREYGSPAGPASRPSSSGIQTPVKSNGSPEKEKDSGSVIESPDGKGNGSSDKDARDSKDKGRGKYVCGKCGAPKKGHNCPYQPKLKRRPDEPLPEMRNAAAQVEIDEMMVIRRLNLEIQGLPQTYVDEATFLQATNVDSDSYTYNSGPYSPPAAGPDTVAVGAGRERQSEEREAKTMVSTGVGPGPEDMDPRYASTDPLRHPTARRAPGPDGQPLYEQRQPRRLSPRPRDHFTEEDSHVPLDRNMQIGPALGERQEPVGHSVASAP